MGSYVAALVVLAVLAAGCSGPGGSPSATPQPAGGAGPLDVHVTLVPDDAVLRPGGRTVVRAEAHNRGTAPYTYSACEGDWRIERIDPAGTVWRGQENTMGYACPTHTGPTYRTIPPGGSDFHNVSWAATVDVPDFTPEEGGGIHSYGAQDAAPGRYGFRVRFQSGGEAWANVTVAGPRIRLVSLDRDVLDAGGSLNLTVEVANPSGAAVHHAGCAARPVEVEVSNGATDPQGSPAPGSTYRPPGASCPGAVARLAPGAALVHSFAWDGTFPDASGRLARTPGYYTLRVTFPYGDDASDPDAHALRAHMSVYVR